MDVEMIKTKKQYEEQLKWIDKMLDTKINPDSAEGKKLQAVLVLVKEYEDRHYPIPFSK